MAERSRSTKRINQAIEIGYWMAVTLPKDTAPLRCYVGQVQAVDEHGIRLTLVDWFAGRATGFDLFVPWSNIESALIATPDHSTEYFGQEAEKWQTAMMNDQKNTEN